mmetsp:Transcript_75332/g.244993  ORF Transcript_75332/g.244993 Transcript_75332/m.244993 type:complete len:83 (-) Transcript_75332:1673-1921(-)
MHRPGWRGVRPCGRGPCSEPSSYAQARYCLEEKRGFAGHAAGCTVLAGEADVATGQSGGHPFAAKCTQLEEASQARPGTCAL